MEKSRTIEFPERKQYIALITPKTVTSVHRTVKELSELRRRYIEQETDRRFGIEDFDSWMKEQKRSNGPDMDRWGDLICGDSNAGPRLVLDIVCLKQFINEWGFEITEPSVLPFVSRADFIIYDIDDDKFLVVPKGVDGDGILFLAKVIGEKIIQMSRYFPRETEPFFTKDVMSSLRLTWALGEHERSKGARNVLCTHYEQYAHKELQAIIAEYHRAAYVHVNENEVVVPYVPDMLVLFGDGGLPTIEFNHSPNSVTFTHSYHCRSFVESLDEYLEDVTETPASHKAWFPWSSKKTSKSKLAKCLQRNLEDGNDQAILRTLDEKTILLTHTKYVTTK